MAPVARALASRGLDHRLLLTGQHSGLGRQFELPGESVRQLGFDPRGRSQRDFRRALHTLLCGEFHRERADLILVQGDTTSAVAGAYAARDCGIPLGHVEAGLRSFDLRQPHPEEGHRIVIDALSQLLFAPTATAAENLRRERCATSGILITGNTGIDALLHMRARLERRAPAAGDGRKLVLATCHRRENRGKPVRAICEALKHLVGELPVRVAALLHPNRHGRKALEAALAGVEHIELLEPLDYGEMVRLMDESWLILSDSGGLQEEAPALGRPLLVLRDVTERPEALATGNIALVGTDPGRIVAAVERLLACPQEYARMSRPAFPFGDGRAAERIAAAVISWLGERRPASKAPCSESSRLPAAAGRAAGPER